MTDVRGGSAGGLAADGSHDGPMDGPTTVGAEKWGSGVLEAMKVVGLAIDGTTDGAVVVKGVGLPAELEVGLQAAEVQEADVGGGFVDGLATVGPHASVVLLGRSMHCLRRRWRRRLMLCGQRRRLTWSMSGYLMGRAIVRFAKGCRMGQEIVEVAQLVLTGMRSLLLLSLILGLCQDRLPTSS